MTPSRILAWTVLAILVAVAVVAFGRTAGAGERGDWFRSLKQPGSGTSCCDVSDCKRSDAEFRNGQWWAVVAGEWTPIPPDKELLDRQSIDGEAYVCASPKGLIYCFVAPHVIY